MTRYWGLRGNEALQASGSKCDLEMKTCIDYKTRPALGSTEEDVKGVSRSPYVWDPEGNSLGRWPTNVNVVKDGTKYIGDDHPSPDFSHYVFSSVNIPFTPDGIDRDPRVGLRQRDRRRHGRKGVTALQRRRHPEGHGRFR